MAQIEINIPDRIDMKITQLIDQGEFATREEAVEELLSTGVRAFKTNNRIDEIEQDPYGENDGMMGHQDDYVF